MRDVCLRVCLCANEERNSWDHIRPQRFAVAADFSFPGRSGSFDWPGGCCATSVFRAKYLLLAILALYIASPIDAIPDLLVGVGQLDDMGMAIALIMVTLRLLPKLAPAEVVEQHVCAMQGTCTNTRTQTVDQPFDARFTIR